ncbi:protein mono-ADP-ribosyltransferase PARP12-like [Antedon mediterranea]|uniref:protein mono-ADP-ribosyltransferase PARP12-like n=1 Tax=Antedon mediterranea TaxID=105859 RepID=UPI003AF633A4
MQAQIRGICRDHLKGNCSSGSMCQRMHCNLPYQWQYNDGRQWLKFKDRINLKLEGRFCGDINDAKSWSYSWQNRRSTVNSTVSVTFDDMCRFDGLNKFLVQRLEVEGDDDNSDADLISPWIWYFNGDDRWMEYSKENSDKVNNAYEIGITTANFVAGDQHYTLNFFDMSQTNHVYETKRSVCRRPVKQIKSEDVEKYREDKPWLHSLTKTHRLVRVSKKTDSKEHKEILELFTATLPDGAITQLERIENECCREAFARKNEIMVKKNSNREVEELRLFHGTMHDKVDDICCDNFDFRLSGTRVGHVYGQGAYFATSAKYSNDYAEEDGVGIKRMFVVRVLVGSYTVGTKEMRRPPLKYPENKSKGFYDSCVNNVASPSIFVVFDNDQECIISEMHIAVYENMF